MALTIYNPDGSTKAEVMVNEGSRAVASLMSSDYIEVKFSLGSPVTFDRGCYCNVAMVRPSSWWESQEGTFYLLDCNGDYLLDREGYFLEYGNCSSVPVHYVVTERATPTYNSGSGAWEYKLKLDAWYWSWDRYVVRLRPKYGASSASFGFTNTFIEHVRMILANIYQAKEDGDGIIELPDRIVVHYLVYTEDGGEKTYHEKKCWYKFDGETGLMTETASETSTEEVDYYSNESAYLIEENVKYIGYSGTTAIEAIKDICSEDNFNTEWWMDGMDMHFGRCEAGTPMPIKNDVDALISRSSSSGEYATRIIAFGGTTNVPARYRKRLILHSDSTTGAIDTTRPMIASYFKSAVRSRKSGGGSLQQTLTGSDIVNATMVGAFQVDPGHNCRFEMFIKNMAFTKPLPSSGWEEVMHNIAYLLDESSISIRFYDSEGTELPSLTIQNEGYTSERLSQSIRVTILFPSTTDFTVPEDAATCKVTLDGIASSDLLSDVSVSIYAAVYYTDYCIRAYAKTLSGQTYAITVNEDCAEPTGKDSAVISGLSGLPTGTDFYFAGSAAGTENDCIELDSVPVSYFTDDFNEDDIISSYERRIMLPKDRCPLNYIETEDADEDKSKVVELVKTFDDVYPTMSVPIARVEWYKERVANEYDTGTEYTYPICFYIFIRKEDLDFSCRYIIEGKDLGITFTTGMLAGYTFGLKFDGDVSTANEDGKVLQRYRVVRDSANGISMPNALICPTGETNVSITNQAGTTPDVGEEVTTTGQTGDKVALLNYNAKSITELGLVSEAEERLYRQAKAYLDKVSRDDGTYTAKMFHTFFEELDAMPGLGQKVSLTDEGLFQSARQTRVIGYEIPLDINIDHPTYTLGESPRYSRLGAIEKGKT